MSKSTLQIPDLPKQALVVVGHILVVARKQKRWQQSEVAERVGVTRQTIARMEGGDPSVAAGTYFAAAWLLDAPIFPGMELRRQNATNVLGQVVSMIHELMPKRVSKTDREIDDEF